MADLVEKFTFDYRDEYNRKPIAEKVIRLLTSNIPVSPMVIDGGWGTGKTEFCHKLIHLLESRDTPYTPVYVDAFHADHADEPLMTLLASVLRLMSDDEKRDGLIKKSLPAIRFGVKTTLKAGVSWLLRQDAANLAEDFESDVKRAGDEAINHAVESLLIDHVNANESIELLKTALGEIAKKNPIIIFIDELDRCRPDFAVAMLESIKHIFDVKGVEFVLITNADQLRASINHCYGPTVDAQRYLDKFIGFSFMLPVVFTTNGHNEQHSSEVHFSDLIKKSEFLSDSELAMEGHAIRCFADKLLKINQLSLREVETFIHYLEVYQVLTEAGGLSKNINFGHGLLRIFGVFLFCFYPDIRSKLSEGLVDAKAITAVLGKSEWPDFGEGRPEHIDAIAAMIWLSDNVGKEAFPPGGEEATKEWEIALNDYFSGRSFCGPEGRIKIMTGVIQTLKLGNHAA